MTLISPIGNLWERGEDMLHQKKKKKKKKNSLVR